MEKSVIRFVKKFNIGNYEAEEYGIETSVDADKHLEGFATLKKEITEAFNIGRTVTEQPAPKAESVSKPKTTPKKEEAKAEETKVEEKVEEKKEEKKVEEKKTTRKASSKIVNYDRTDLGHKEALKAVLKAIKPDYASKANLETATKASTGMVGKPFLGEDGNVLQSFVDEFLSYYA